MMKDLLKKGRLDQGLSTRKLAEMADIDQALISKFENGYRIPTKKQIQTLATLLKIDLRSLLVAWYKVKLDHVFDFNTFAIQAITEILQEKGVDVSNSKKENQIAEILDEIELLKQKLTNLR
ncbi:multiprotein-bridging factor 1 family protein [Flavobacterium chuncheonense]|uniref:Multiprotein-bridging factor 1 family protein n=1 Tax=Flavobacterium chuncheonense TaxID=2026653 RepID=A0ABW5YKE2_9FLAO